MTILCIETSTNCCSAAICIDGKPLATCDNLIAANHASELPVFIEQLLSQAHAADRSIDAVALSEGPGSYTGLRIGTSIAKGLCYGRKIPLIPIDTLQILCATLHHTTTYPTSALLCPMLDARRMEVYTAFYLPNTLHRTTEVKALIIDQHTFTDELTQQPILFFGNGANKCREVIISNNALFIDHILPQAQYMGYLAERSLHAQLDTKQMAYYQPFYLKDFVAAPSHVKGLK